MKTRFERRGTVDPLTPRFIRFLQTAWRGQSLNDEQASTERRANNRCLDGLPARIGG